MTIPQFMPDLYTTFSHIHTRIQDNISKPVETIKELALPIITSLGELSSYGISCVGHVFTMGVNSFSDLISALNRLVSRLFSQAKEAPITEVEKSQDPAPPVPKTEVTIPLVDEDKTLNPYYLNLEQIRIEMRIAIDAFMQETSEIMTKYYPTGPEQEKFITELREELDLILERTNFDIDPVTQNLEEYFVPKETVFTQSKLIGEVILTKTSEFVVNNYPSQEAQTQFMANVKSELDITLEKIKAISAEEHEEALKILDHVDSGSMY
ncbi:MAG: hypothetical protein V4489_00900 [Chlamydiota bacterium]